MLINVEILLRSWKVAECSLVDNLIAKKLTLATFRPDAPVLLSYINVGKMFSVYKNQLLPPDPLTVQILSGITKFMKLLGDIIHACRVNTRHSCINPSAENLRISTFKQMLKMVTVTTEVSTTPLVESIRIVD